MAKVLIVDDDKTTVMLLQTLLQLDGFEVKSVGRGNEVMPLVDEYAPNIILMDYNLTDIKGVEVLRDLRATERYADLPVVMASGLDVSDEVLAAGADEFLIKPFEPGDLAGLFNRLIEER